MAKKHMDLGEHLEYIESLLGGGGSGGNVNDVTVNGSSVVTDKVAAIKLKTINNESITGTGNIKIEGGSSAPYEADLTISEKGVYMTQEDLDYIHENKPGVVIVHQKHEGPDVAQTYTLAGYLTVDGSAYGRMTYQSISENRSTTLVSLPTNASDPLTTVDFTYATTDQLEYTVIDFNEDDQGDQTKLAQIYRTCPQLLRIHSNRDGLQMYRLDIDDKELRNTVHYSCLISGAIIGLSITNSDGTYTLGVVTYGLTPINA